MMLKTRNLTVKFNEVTALHKVNTEFLQGETSAVFGANGSGKTTLLKALAGLVPITGGRIFFFGEEITDLPPKERIKRGIQYIPDRARVGMKMSVEENLRIGGFLRKRGVVERAIEATYDLFPDLYSKRHEPAGILSGGQRQMLVIGRAYVSSPKVMLFDEPFLGLSMENRKKMIGLIGTFHGLGITIIMAEHDVDEILPLSRSYLVFLNGEIVEKGPGGKSSSPELLKKAFRKFYQSGRNCGEKGRGKGH